MEPTNHLSFVERVTTGIGSFTSLVVHTICFAAALLIGALHVLSWDTVLLVLTTGVSLEAIYLAIFIQMSVNHQSKVIKDVEQDVDEIKEDVDEIQEDVGEIQEDVDEIQKDIDAIEEDVDDIQEDEAEDDRREREHQETLAAMAANLQKLLNDIEKMKKS